MSKKKEIRLIEPQDSPILEGIKYIKKKTGIKTTTGVLRHLVIQYTNHLKKLETRE